MTGLLRPTIRGILVLLPLLAFATAQWGCSIQPRLVADYDELIDHSVAELQTATNAFIHKMLEHAPLDARFHEQHGAFFETARGRIAMLIVRSEILEDGLPASPLADNFRHLQVLMDQFEEGVRPREDGRVLLSSRPLIESTSESLNRGFRAIVTHMLFLKKASESRR